MSHTGQVFSYPYKLWPSGASLFTPNLFTIYMPASISLKPIINVLLPHSLMLDIKSHLRRQEGDYIWEIKLFASLNLALFKYQAIVCGHLKIHIFSGITCVTVSGSYCLQVNARPGPCYLLTTGLVLILAEKCQGHQRSHWMLSSYD